MNDVSSPNRFVQWEEVKTRHPSLFYQQWGENHDFNLQRQVYLHYVEISFIFTPSGLVRLLFKLAARINIDWSFFFAITSSPISVSARFPVVKPRTVKSLCLIWTSLISWELEPGVLNEGIEVWLHSKTEAVTAHKSGQRCYRGEEVFFLFFVVPLSKPEIFRWSLSSFIKAKRLRGRPRDFKALPHWQLLAKKVELWSVESKWKLCNNNKKN